MYKPTLIEYTYGHLARALPYISYMSECEWAAFNGDTWAEEVGLELAGKWAVIEENGQLLWKMGSYCGNVSFHLSGTLLSRR